jgi:hypothetical protein
MRKNGEAVPPTVIPSNIKFHQNSSSYNQVFHKDRQTDMTKLIVASCNCAKTPKIPSLNADTEMSVVGQANYVESTNILCKKIKVRGILC